MKGYCWVAGQKWVNPDYGGPFDHINRSRPQPTGATKMHLPLTSWPRYALDLPFSKLAAVSTMLTPDTIAFRRASPWVTLLTRNPPKPILLTCLPSLPIMLDNRCERWAKFSRHKLYDWYLQDEAATLSQDFTLFTAASRNVLVI